jgi:hypothetical protein
MSGPRYGGRGRSKCMIRNESIIDEGRNRFKRAPRQTSAHAGPVRLAPRPAPRGGHWGWGGSAQSARASGPDEPVIHSSSRASARRRSRCRNATLAAGRADRERDRLASSKEPRAPLRLRLPACMRGQAQRMWPCLCCMLHAGCGPDAAWAVAGGGRGMALFDQDQAITQPLPTSPLLQPIPQICSYGRTVRIMCKQVTKLTKISFEM